MKTIRIFLLILIIVLDSIFFTGCWNYREIDQLAVVAGVAIDKGTHEKFNITVEIVEISAGREAETKSKTITIEGNTIFDAARHAISVTGKRMYWAHAKAVIISRELAEEGVVQILDWFNRDAETRGDIHIMVSKEKNAKDILAASGVTGKVVAYEIDKILAGQRSLSNAPQVEISKFTNYLVNGGVGATAPAVDLRQVDGEKVLHVMGTAVFKGDKLLGFMDGQDTKSMLFVQDEISGGILVAEETEEDKNTTVSLEIFNSKTKIKPVYENGNITMDISVETTVAIDEIETTVNVIEAEASKKLETAAEKMLKNGIETAIEKVQSEYGVDIFGFGIKLKQSNAKVWNTVSHNWGEIFKNLKVNVNTKVHIKNSAMMSKPLEVGD